MNLRSELAPATTTGPQVNQAAAPPSQGASETAWMVLRAVAYPLLVSLLFAVGGLAFLVIGIGRPSYLYYDEPYFVPEARAFIQGVPNPHPECPPLAKPPLGKLIMAVGMKLAGDDPFGWRIAGALCGALTLAAIYLWSFLLLRDYGLACVATMLALFNNFWYVMSRIGMMDAFLLLFLMCSLVVYTAALTCDISVGLRRFLFVSSGALVGLAGACKWNAIDTLAVFFLVSFALRQAGRHLNRDSSLWRYASNIREIGTLTILGGLVVSPLLAYSLAFLPLCRLIHRPFSFHELLAMNAFIWKINSTVVANKAITSRWYTWPLNLHPQRALSYLVGNPVVSWGGLLALASCVRRFRKTAGFAEGLVLLLFFSNYLQWAVTPQKGLFYYYYYPSVTILGVAIAVALRHLPHRLFGVRISLLVVVAAMVVFVWCYPRMANLQAPWDCALGCWS